MKTKTKAAKVLLKAGWTWEEIEAVLGKENTIYVMPEQRATPQWYYYPCPSVPTRLPTYELTWSSTTVEE